MATEVLLWIFAAAAVALVAQRPRRDRLDTRVLLHVLPQPAHVLKRAALALEDLGGLCLLLLFVDGGVDGAGASAGASARCVGVGVNARVLATAQVVRVWVCLGVEVVFWALAPAERTALHATIELAFAQKLWCSVRCTMGF